MAISSSASSGLHRRSDQRLPVSPAGVVIVAALAAAVLLSCVPVHVHGVAVKATCNLSNGRWVFDPTYKPLYDGTTCGDMQSVYNCQRNGRKDTAFAKWHWQAPNCNLTRFKPLEFLALMRNKVLLTVGDSMSGNFRNALYCNVKSGAAVATIVKSVGNLKKVTGYTVPSYNATFIQVPSSFLVNSSSVGKASSAGLWNVYLDQVDGMWASKLPWVDVFVFNTGNWFINAPSNLRHYYIAGKLQTNITQMTAMTTALTTVRNYLLRNFKGKSFINTSPAYHYAPTYQRSTGIKSCVNVTQPFTPAQADYATNKTEAEAARRVQLQVFRKYPQFKIVDITRLTQLRPDGHLGIFKGTGFPDCSHWCLPGVPDTWVEIFFAYLAGRI